MFSGQNPFMPGQNPYMPGQQANPNQQGIPPQSGSTNYGILAPIAPKSGVIAQGQMPSDGGDDIGSGIAGLLGGLKGLTGGGSNMVMNAGASATPHEVMNSGINSILQNKPQQSSMNQAVGNQVMNGGIGNTSDSRMQQIVQGGSQIPKALQQSPAFQTTMSAYKNAQQQGITKSPYATVVDFSQPADSKRLWVIDTRNNSVAMNTFVTQGAPGFSNTPGSHQSSLGTYITGSPYQGKHGPSLRVQGLDPGINDNAASRDITVHPADYAASGGRSFGCFGVPPQDAMKFAKLTAGGSIIHAWAPNNPASNPRDNNFLSNPSAAKGILNTPGNNPFRPTQQGNAAPLPNTNQQLGTTLGQQQNNNQAQTQQLGTTFGQSARPNNMNPQTLDLIKGFEGYETKPYWDVNAYRTGYGSDTVTRADGTIEKVKPGTTISRDDAERDLARRTQGFENTVRKQIGDNVWSSLPPNAQSALTSVAYNYGSIPKRIVGDVQTGDLNTISKAIRRLQGDNKGINKGRRNKEADLVLNPGSMKTSMGPTPVSPYQSNQVNPPVVPHDFYENAVKMLDNGKDDYSANSDNNTIV